MPNPWPTQVHAGIAEACQPGSWHLCYTPGPPQCMLGYYSPALLLSSVGLRVNIDKFHSSSPMAGGEGRGVVHNAPFLQEALEVQLLHHLPSRREKGH